MVLAWLFFQFAIWHCTHELTIGRPWATQFFVCPAVLVGVTVVPGAFSGVLLVAMVMVKGRLRIICTGVLAGEWIWSDPGCIGSAR